MVPNLDDADRIDLQGNFDHNRPWFFLLMASLPAISLIEESLRDGGLPLDTDTVFRIGLGAAALVAAMVRSRRFHIVNAVLSLGALCTCFVMLFLRLQ